MSQLTLGCTSSSGVLDSPVFLQVMCREHASQWHQVPDKKLATIYRRGTKYFRLQINHFTDFAVASRSMVRQNIFKWPFASDRIEVRDGSRGGTDCLCCLVFDHLWYHGFVKELAGVVGANGFVQAEARSTQEICHRASMCASLLPYHGFKIGECDLWDTAIPNTWQGGVVGLVLALYNARSFRVIGVKLVSKNTRLTVYREKLCTVGAREVEYDQLPHDMLKAALLQQ